MGYKLLDSVNILAGGNNDVEHIKHIHYVLENSASPITSKYKEKLFQSIIDKSHIDFGDISKSAGDIKSYSGYPTMIETLATITALAKEQKVSEAIRLADIVLKAIENIANLRTEYTKGFETGSDYVMLEYNVYTYTCVEATTTLVYEFADYVKVPDRTMLQIKLKNTKLRANEFYFEQLSKFNSVNENMGINYRKMLDAMCAGGKNNFIGLETIVGISAISAVCVLIIPVTRALIYQIYHLRNKISDSFEMQAKFLEINRMAVESNEAFTIDKKKDIINKQEKIANTLKVLAGKIRVHTVTASRAASADLKRDNGTLTLNNIQDSVNSEPLVLL